LVIRLKKKPIGCVEVVLDENKDTSVEDDIFQVGELVEPYRVTPSIDLEYNSNFHVFDNSLVNVDTEVLNVVMSSSGQAQIDEDDHTNVINIEDCSGDDNDSIEEEEEDNYD
jgi:hypothetical protein